MHGFLVILLPSAAVAMLLRSSVSQTSTTKGMRTTHETIKRISSPPHVVIDTLLNFNSWPQWISTGSKFSSEISKFSDVGQSCRENFGLLGSSSITWTVTSLSLRELIVTSSKSKGTFGWDNLEMEFSVADDASMVAQGSLLTFKYSWTVSNEIIAFFERAIIRQNMMADNVIAVYKLGEICEQQP